jgi:hypothetical protein
MLGMRWPAALALIAGCSVRDATFLDADTTIDVVTFRARPNPDLDLLLVIDDSPSMQDKQDALSNVFPQLVQELAGVEGGLPNLHVGVVSTDMGTSGSGVATPGPSIGQIGNGGCAGTGKAGVMQTHGVALTSGNFVVDQRDGTKNYTGALDAALASMIRLGDGGCGFEQTLAAMRAALESPANTGFLRPDANLAIIVLSDEDDCSILDPAVLAPATPELGPLQSFRCFQFGVQCDPDEPKVLGPKQSCRARATSTFIEDVAPFAAFLRGIKPDPHAVMFGAVVGDPAPVGVELRTPPGGGTAIAALAHSCTFPVGPITAVADPAVRIAQLTDAVHGHLESVCSADLSRALGAMGKGIKALVGDRCLPAAPPDGAECTLIDTSSAGTETLPACDGSGADCWEIVADPIGCPDAPQQRIDVHRSAPPPDDTWSTLRCRLRES